MARSPDGGRGAEARAAGASPADASRRPTYREFPHLFWDLAPEEPVDVESEFVLTRLLTRGRPADLRALVSVELIARRLPALPLASHSRAFWERVVSVARGHSREGSPGAREAAEDEAQR